jgi:hypothetical protein
VSRLPRATVSLNALLMEAAEEIDASTAPIWDDDAPIWEPIAGGPQVRAYDSLADELFYGGAGGGGKTDLVLGLAATKHKRSIIFRREYAQFKGAGGMWERAKEIVGLRGDPVENPLMIRGLPGGRAIEFGAVQREQDWAKYKGRPHDLKAFDELPEFTELQYRALIGWLRTTLRGQRTRVVGTGNPPTTSDGQWVIKYWGPWLDPTHPHPAADGELRWYANVDGVDVERPDGTPFMDADPQGKPMRVVPRSRTFIRARVEDNPFYMRTGYDQVLNSLPEPLRSQLRFGDFAKTVADNPWQVIPTAWVVAAQGRWTPDGGAGWALTQAGNDPSRGGEDEFVIAKRHGPWVAPLVVHAASEAPDGPHGAALVYRALAGNGAVPVLVDIIGTAGSSVYDHALGLGLAAVSINGSEKSLAKDKSGKLGFANLRAEIHWKMRELLDPANGHDLALPPDAQLRSDLCAMRWHPTPRGIQIELKDDVKARLGRSPDRGEAVMYACVSYTPEVKRKLTSATWR